MTQFGLFIQSIIDSFEISDVATYEEIVKKCTDNEEIKDVSRVEDILSFLCHIELLVQIGPNVFALSFVLKNADVDEGKLLKEFLEYMQEFEISKEKMGIFKNLFFLILESLEVPTSHSKLKKKLKGKKEFEELLEILKFIKIVEETEDNKLELSKKAKVLSKIEDVEFFLSSAYKDFIYYNEMIETNAEASASQLTDMNMLSTYTLKILSSYQKAIAKEEVKLKLFQIIKQGKENENEDMKKILNESFEKVISSLTNLGIVKQANSIGFMTAKSLNITELSNSFYPKFIDRDNCILVPLEFQVGTRRGSSKGEEAEQPEDDFYDEDDDDDYEDDYYE